MTTLSMAVPFCFHMLVCGGSFDGVTILALVVVQFVILATHFLACSVMILKGIWPTACLRVLLSRTSVSNGVVGSLFPWMLLLSGRATLGCSTQALLTILLPLLSRTSHLSGKCVNDFCHCSCSSAVLVRGSPASCCGFFFPLWSFSEAFVRVFSGSCTKDRCESFDPYVESLMGCLSLFSLVQHSALNAVAEELRPSERLLAFLDDIRVVCVPDRVATIYALLQNKLWQHARIRVNLGKTQLWNRGGVFPWVVSHSSEQHRRLIHTPSCGEGVQIFQSTSKEFACSEHRWGSQSLWWNC